MYSTLGVAESLKDAVLAMSASMVHTFIITSYALADKGLFHHIYYDTTLPTTAPMCYVVIMTSSAAFSTTQSATITMAARLSHGALT